MVAKIVLAVFLLSAASCLAGQYGLDVDIAGQYPPAAADVSGEVWHRHVYHHDSSRLWNGLYIREGADWEINPAYGRIGAFVEWMPAAVLQLRAQLDRYAFFGTNGSLLIYTDDKAPFGSADYKQRRGQEISAQANRLLLQPTLQVSLGSYVVVNQFAWSLYDFERNGPYFWEQEYDTLLKRHDRLYVEDLSLLYDWGHGDTDQRLLVGPGFQIVHASGAGLTRIRLGLSLYFEPISHGSSAGYRVRPRVYFQAGINTHDRNQGGRAYFMGGVGSEFDFD